jgi:hypothetical protein
VAKRLGAGATRRATAAARRAKRSSSLSMIPDSWGPEAHADA